jgi:hypothetical protein
VSSELGTSFIIKINYNQLLSCIGEPIFQSKEDISYIPTNWLLHLRQFIIEINASLEIRNIWLPKSQRANDQFLMTAFRKMKATRAELIILNNWRIYYKVILLSEICFASGKGIQLCFLEYNHSPITRQSSSNVNWPIQGKQDERSSKVWKRFIKQ